MQAPTYRIREKLVQAHPPSPSPPVSPTSMAPSKRKKRATISVSTVTPTTAATLQHTGFLLAQKANNPSKSKPVSATSIPLPNEDHDSQLVTPDGEEEQPDASVITKISEMSDTDISDKFRDGSDHFRRHQISDIRGRFSALSDISCFLDSSSSTARSAVRFCTQVRQSLQNMSPSCAGPYTTILNM